MNQHNIVLQEKTKKTQKLPRDLDDKLHPFTNTSLIIIESVKNMDETPVFFNMVDNKIVKEAGEKSIFVKTTDHK